MGSSADPNSINTNNNNNNNNNNKDNNNNLNAIDASVGGLVWVRRRNGAWWPGQIMGLDEVTEDSLVSPKSGTPVKLLGREDAIVDWYNLEKSKRVKSFRCGEYDECIEKAKAAAANGNKKVVKYARREDAILCALEIENARLSKDCLDFSLRTNYSGINHGISARKSTSMSISGKEEEDTTDEQSYSELGSASDSGSGPDVGSDLDLELAPELSQSVISFEDPNHIGPSKIETVQEKRRRTPNDSEDEGIKRMRGLEDLGIGVGDSNINCLSNGSPTDGSKGNNSSLRRKRSQVASVHELLKRRNRRRPLTKVLQSTAMVSVPVVCDRFPNGSPLQGLSDNKVSGTTVETIESKRGSCMGVLSENGALVNLPDLGYEPSDKVKQNDICSTSRLAENNASNRLFDVPFVGEGKTKTGNSPLFGSSSSVRNHFGGPGKQSSHISQADAISLKNEGHHHIGSTGSAAIHSNGISQRMEKSTSKWQLKGKRNSRHKSRNRKRDSRKYADMDNEPYARLAGMGHLDGYSQGPDQQVHCDGIRRSHSSYAGTLQVKPKPFGDDKVDGVQDWRSFSYREPNVRKSMVEVSLPPQRSLPYRQSRFTVNSRYQTSDLPGRNFISNSKLYDVKVQVNSNYRPQHVPLVSLRSKLNGTAIVGHPLTIVVLEDGYCDFMISCKNGNATDTTAKAATRNSLVGKVPGKLRMAQPNGKSQKSKKNGALKTRTLSSLTGHKEDKKLMVEKPKGPVIACIPIKLVFSRVNEAVNGSARQIYRAPASTDS